MDRENCIGQHNFEVQELSGEVYVVCRKCGVVANKDERRDTLYPMKSGERIMYAVLGRNGGIFAFVHSAWKAREIQKDYWSIGVRNAKRYRVYFEEDNS